MNVVGTALDELYRYFSILNKEKFNDELPYPVITIQKGKGVVAGLFVPDRAWQKKDEEEPSLYEISIDPRFFDRSVNEIIGTLLHEMCHYYNAINGTTDCNGKNHNKNFKVIAESVGLICEKEKGVGYGLTSNSDELNQFIEEEITPDESSFEYFRYEAPKEIKPKNKTTFTFTCPSCGMKAKGKQNIHILCGDCDKEMEIEEVEEENTEDKGDED